MPGLAGQIATGIVPVRSTFWSRVASWLVPPRRVKPTKTGWLYTGLSAAIAIAALNTGNNVLFIFLGLLFGLVAASGMWSEAVLRHVDARVQPGPWIDAGSAAAIPYRITVRRKRINSYLLQVFPEIRHPDDRPRTAWQKWKRNRWWTPLERNGVRIVSSPWVQQVLAGTTFDAHVEVRFARRGIYRVQHVEIGTLFPFGIIEKRRRNDDGAEIVVAPAPLGAAELSDLEQPSPEAEQTGRHADPTGEYDGLRPFQPGDSPRLISWRASARSGELMVRIHRELVAPRVVLELEPFGGQPEELFNNLVEQKRLDRQVALARTLIESLREQGYEVRLHDLPSGRGGLSGPEARVLAGWNGEPLSPVPAVPGEGRLRIARNGQIVVG